MANEFTPLATAHDYIRNVELQIDVVHREDGGIGYRLTVFDRDLIGSDGDQFDGCLEEIQTSCIRAQH